MVSSVAEAPSLPIAEGGQKAEEQSGGGGFMAMLAGMVSGQTGQTGQNQQQVGSADAAAPVEVAIQIDPTAAVLTGTQPLTQGQAPVDETKVGQTQMAEQPQPGLVDAAKAKQAEGEGPIELPIAEPSAEDSKAEAEAIDAALEALASEQTTPEIQTEQPVVETQPVDNQPTAVDPAKQAVVDALQDMTVQQPQAKPMPEAAKPQSEIAATIVAAKLNPMGQKSQNGEVLLNGDGQSKAKDVGSDGPAKNIAASAIAGASKPEQTSSSAGTPIQVQWTSGEPVTISASPNAAFQDNLQFANGGAAKSEPKDAAVENNPQQAFGVEMKAQLGTETAVRHAGSAQAQAPQTDPTLGEKMVGQIVREVSLHKLGDNTTLSVRLDPPELGTLRINVTSQSGVLTTRLESPNAVVRGILETHLPALKEALSSAGVEVSKFSVSSGLDFGAHAQRQQQAWQPTRFAPAVEFNPQMQDMQPVIQAAVSGNQAQAANHSWLA